MRPLIVPLALLAAACGAPDLEDEEDTGSRWTAAALPETIVSEMADLVAGDLYLDGDLAIEVPEVGAERVLLVDFEDGGSMELRLSNPTLGVVTAVKRVGPVEAVEPVPMAALSACADGAYGVFGARWTTTYRWTFQSGSIPGSVTAAGAETALRRAADHIAHSYNDCGLADQVSATHTYAGRTTRAPGISYVGGQITCKASDGVNVVGFGALPSGVLGIACMAWSGTSMVSGDVRFNKARSWFAGSTVPAGCSGRTSLEGVATHELGHVFGLKDVSAATHPRLTMRSAASACDVSAKTLGLGDVRGLRALY